MRKRHGLRRIFSLLLAVIMVCALLPTAALAEDTTETNPIVAGDTMNAPTKTDAGTAQTHTTNSRRKHLPLGPSGKISGV